MNRVILYSRENVFPAELVTQLEILIADINALVGHDYIERFLVYEGHIRLNIRQEPDNILRYYNTAYRNTPLPTTIEACQRIINEGIKYIELERPTIL